MGWREFAAARCFSNRTGFPSDTRLTHGSDSRQAGQPPCVHCAALSIGDTGLSYATKFTVSIDYRNMPRLSAAGLM